MCVYVCVCVYANTPVNYLCRYVSELHLLRVWDQLFLLFAFRVLIPRPLFIRRVFKNESSFQTNYRCKILVLLQSLASYHILHCASHAKY